MCRKPKENSSEDLKSFSTENLFISHENSQWSYVAIIAAIVAKMAHSRHAETTSWNFAGHVGIHIKISYISLVTFLIQ